ncbi:MAG: AAA family ATPase, partial [Firmicutes bacterium]|nr:AAA family ATPase [Bacillota bacterium]
SLPTGEGDGAEAGEVNDTPSLLKMGEGELSIPSHLRGEGKGEGAGIIGRLADLIKFPGKIRNAMEALIGNVFVVSSIAPSLLKMGEGELIEGDFIFVTLEGDVLSKSYIIGGSTKVSKGSILSRKREKEQLQKEKESLEISLLQAEKDYQDSTKNFEKLAKSVEELWQKEGKLKLELASAKNEIESFDLRLQGIESTASKLAESEKEMLARRESLEKEISDAGIKLKEITFSLNKYREELGWLEKSRESGASDRSTMQEDINSIKVERARAIQRKEDSLRALDEIRKNLTESENTAKKLEAEEKALKKKKSENDDEIIRGRNTVTTLRMKVKAWEDMLQSLAGEREALTGQLELLDKEIESFRTFRMEHKEKCHNIDIKDAEYQVEHRDRMSRLKELEAGYAKLLAELGEEKTSSRKAQALEKEAIEKEILRLRNFIKNFGSVNLGAMEDYQKHEERYNYLQSQIQDLEDASASLIKVMEEIDEVSAKQFKETFEAVREQFSEVFVKVFGGGQAHLVLSNPDNLLESGVEIVAQPPQRRLQNLALLSSGERALTATAFLLAILKVKPSPFVIFDELDASLDDANVDKIAKIIEEFAAQTQFIIITHNRRTMESASVLYGVTMEEPGVSKIISVKMEEAIEKLEQEKEKVGSGLAI